MKLGLRKRARLIRRVPTGTRLLVYPERALELNESAAEVIELIDGRRTQAEIVLELATRHDARIAEIERGVSHVVEELRKRALIEERR